MKRTGFSLIELLIATAILAFVVTEGSLLFVGLLRMQKERMWNAEFADRLRVARERLLFHSEYGGEGRSGGLIGARDLVWHVGSDRGELVAYLQKTLNDTSTKPVYDPNPHNFDDFEIVDVDDGERSIVTERVTNSLVFISVKTTIRPSAHEVSNRVERIAVPLFGSPPALAVDESKFLWDRFMDVKEMKWIRP